MDAEDGTVMVSRWQRMKQLNCVQLRRGVVFFILFFSLYPLNFLCVYGIGVNGSAMDRQWFELGREIGLAGDDLIEFVRERENTARDGRAQEMELRKHELEIKCYEHEMLQTKLELEQTKKESVSIAGDDAGSVAGSAAGSNDGLENVIQRAAVSAKIPKLPTFDYTKDDMDAYLARFERYATNQGWPENSWAINLSALLKGKSLDVYYRLPVDQTSDYFSLKTALLRRFRLTENGFREKFRTAKPESGETAFQFAVRLENYLTRWVELSSTEKTYEGLTDLLL